MGHTSDSVRRSFVAFPAMLMTFGLVAGIVLIAGCGGGSGDVNRLNGGGATFDDPIMQKWKAAYKTAKNVDIDYVKSGSSDGVRQMIERTNDFGCSDAPMNKKEVEAAKGKGGEVINIPIIMGSVAVIYNVPEAEKQLILSGPILADIYLGNIRSWDDAQIAKLNPGVKLPKEKIIPISRAEGSGTTYIFTDYLSKVSPEFKKEVGPSKDPKWPEKAGGNRQSGSDGVAGFVQKNAHTIGFVELYYAESQKIAVALLQNQAGKAVAPSAAGVVAAAEEAMKTAPTDEPYSLHQYAYPLTNVAGENAYPIAGMSFLVLYKKQPEGKGKALKDFLTWATTEGQKYAEGLSYAPLPSALSAKLQPVIASIELSK